MSKVIFSKKLLVYTGNLQSMLGEPQELNVGESRIVHAASDSMNADKIDIWFEKLRAEEKFPNGAGRHFMVVTDDQTYTSNFAQVSTVIARTGAVYHILRKVLYT